MAARAGFTIPKPTLWAYASDLERESESAALMLVKRMSVPLIARSVSPTEDTKNSSQAGRFRSVVVSSETALQDALTRVIESMPARDGRRIGAVAVQSFL